MSGAPKGRLSADGQPNGSWEENRKFVLAALDAQMLNDERIAAELTAAIKEIRDEVHALRDVQVAIREDLAGLKVKAGILGGMAGALSSFLGHLLNRNP